MASKQALSLIVTNLDIEKLITEVHDRPALWDMSQKDYSDRIKRKQCWEEITELFGFGSNLTLDDKEKLGDILHKKWKNIRDRFTRDIQERKGKSGDGARKKAPYMYGRQLEFLRDTVTPKRTVSSLERTSAESTEVQEERNEEHEGNEEEYELQEATSASSIRSSTSNISRTQVTRVGKKRLHPVEERILHSLDRYKKRATIDKAKEKIEDNDNNRHFLLSLLDSLASLPRHLNTSCRIEIMQCINKYETMSQQHQQPLIYPSTTHSYPSRPQHNPQHQPIHHTQMYAPNQLHSPLSFTSNQLQSESQQYPPRTFVTPGPTLSPAESIGSYISNFTDENDSQLNNC